MAESGIRYRRVYFVGVEQALQSFLEFGITYPN
jgi:hypothetical protein